MDSATLCEACGHELRLQPDWPGRALHCPGCGGRLRVLLPRAPMRFPLRGRKLALVLLFLAVSLPAAFGATMRWSAPPPSTTFNEYPEVVSIPPVHGRQGPSHLLVAQAPMRAEAQLALPVGIDARLEVPADAAPDHGLRLAGRLPASLAFASDPARGLLLSAGADGSLRWYDAETLRPAGGCLLPGPAYQLVCDDTRRRLYAAVCKPGRLQLGPLGDRFSAFGDILVFDLDRLLALAPTATARADKVIASGGHVWAMHLSPDREALHYLAETSQDVQIVRVDLLGRHEPKSLESRAGGIHALTSTPDGKTLFGIAGGRVFAVDVADWSFRWSLLVGGNVLGLTAGPGDMIYLIERRLSLYLVVIDPATQRVVSRSALGVEGRPSLCRSPDGTRVYFSNSAVTSGRILVFEAGEDPIRPRLTGWACGSRDRLIRGGIRLSDDGRFLLTGVGQLFRVGS